MHGVACLELRSNLKGHIFIARNGLQCLRTYAPYYNKRARKCISSLFRGDEIVGETTLGRNTLETYPYKPSYISLVIVPPETFLNKESRIVLWNYIADSKRGCKTRNAHSTVHNRTSRARVKSALNFSRQVANVQIVPATLSLPRRRDYYTDVNEEHRVVALQCNWIVCNDNRVFALLVCARKGWPRFSR